MLSLVFEPNDPTVHPRGSGRFTLYPRAGRFVLPDVVLMPEPGRPHVAVQEVRLSEVTLAAGAAGGAGGDLCREVRSRWPLTQVVSTPLQAVDRTVVASGCQVERPATLPADQAVTAVATWRYVYTDDARLQAAGTARATLTFEIDGAVPTRPRPRLDPDAERLGVPAPVRPPGAHEVFRDLAAIDFGTSASTVTLYDIGRRLERPLDPAQAGRLRQELADLLTAEPPAAARAEWDGALGRLAQSVPDHDGGALTIRRMIERLRQPASALGRDVLLDHVCRQLEQVLQAAQDPLKDWLGPRLLTCYDRAFLIPPLTMFGLAPVQLDVNRQAYEIDTAVGILTRDPLTVEIPSDAIGAIRNVKACLGQPHDLPDTFGRDGKEATTDDLIAHIYATLVEATESFLANREDGKPWTLDHVVVTFPTTLPPSGREHLRNLVRHSVGVKQVVTRYDEGVAAALYFIMRDLGGNRAEFGVEALRARSRQVQQSPPTWRQNAVVIDIGAGTTDIALVRQQLTIPPAPAVTPGPDGRPRGLPPEVRGRYYVVEPRVLNSTGHPQLGGNYLSLRVYYWLKALIVDAMLNAPEGGQASGAAGRTWVENEVRQELALGDGELISLSRLVAENDVETPAPAAVRAALHAVLPTRFDPLRDGIDERRPFEILWASAEEWKIRLGRMAVEDDADDARMDRAEAAAFLTTLMSRKQYGLVDLLPADGLRLPMAEFRGLVRPVLLNVVELAGWLLEKSGVGTPKEPLDRVLLSGRTTLMPLMREAITLGLSGGERSLHWNPATITAEETYAKQAASIGACWAAATKDLSVGPDDPALEQGRSVLHLDVDSAFAALPCEFVQVRAFGETIVLLEAGTPLREVDADGTRAARKEWTGSHTWPRLVPGLQVHRPIRRNVTQAWGSYNFERMAIDEDFVPDPGLWFTDAAGTAGAKVHVQLQIDESLNPTLNICQGRPHYLVTADEQRPVLDMARLLPPECWDSHRRRLTAFPATVVLLAESTGERHEVFGPWTAAELDAGTAFPEFLHDTARLPGPAQPGRIEELPLLPKDLEGQIRVLLCLPDGREEPVQGLRLPRGEGRFARYTATLDVSGRFAVHRGRPPYLPVTTLREVEMFQGGVLHVAMTGTTSNTEVLWDPFNGRH
ncbi:MAG TPA: hypothetical protein VI248_12145 [Kineosporiaceae bacterium]